MNDSLEAEVRRVVWIACADTANAIADTIESLAVPGQSALENQTLLRAAGIARDFALRAREQVPTDERTLANGVMPTTEAWLDLCERVLALEKRA